MSEKLFSKIIDWQLRLTDDASQSANGDLFRVEWNSGVGMRLWIEILTMTAFAHIDKETVV